MSDNTEELDVELGDGEGADVELEEESSSKKDSDVEPTTLQEPAKKEPDEEEDELSSYSKGVQKRIRQLTQKNRESADREQEATRVAQQLYAQTQELNRRLKGLDQGYVTEYGTRLEAELERTKREYREAHDEGDTDKLFAAQQALSRIAIEQERHKLAKARQTEVSDGGNQYQQPAQHQQPAQQPAAPPDPKAQSWAERNEWFGADETMTYAAFGVHRKLVQDEGFDPQSEEYYKEIDSRMRTEFPHKFKASNGKATPVAPGGNSASRNSTTGRRQVKLTPSQVAIANKLGVPLSEYAKYVKG